MDGKRIILAAHKGDNKNHPENTMAAFRAALDAGVDMIETDIRTTRDGVLVLMHDRTALRTAGVDREISEMTLEEVKQLDAGATFSPAFAGEKVPTVREFMEWIKPTNLMINWELKDFPKNVGDERAFESADKLVAMIREFGLEKRSMLNSFSDRVLEHLYHTVGHEFPLHGEGIYKCKRTLDDAQVAEEELFDWSCMYPEEEGKLCIDYKENFDYCLEHGVIPCVCIPDTLENYKKAIEYGCKMFTSNDIYEGDKVLRQLGVRK